MNISPELTGVSIYSDCICIASDITRELLIVLVYATLTCTPYVIMYFEIRRCKLGEICATDVYALWRPKV